MVDVTQNESIFQILIKGLMHFVELACNIILWLISTAFGYVLTAIGFPKDIVVFVLILVVIDTITKLCAIVKQHYNKINLKNLFKAYLTDEITSKAMKTGLGVKVFFYLIFLYIAHQVSYIPEIIGSQFISNTFYSFLFLIETMSIGENLLDCGYKNIEPILKFLNNKEDDLINKKNK